MQGTSARSKASARDDSRDRGIWSNRGAQSPLTDRDFMLRAIELPKNCISEPGKTSQGGGNSGSRRNNSWAGADSGYVRRRGYQTTKQSLDTKPRLYLTGWAVFVQLKHERKLRPHDMLDVKSRQRAVFGRPRVFKTKMAELTITIEPSCR